MALCAWFDNMYISGSGLDASYSYRIILPMWGISLSDAGTEKVRLGKETGAMDVNRM